MKTGVICLLGYVYMRQDPFGTSAKLLQASVAFIRDLADPLWIGSPIRYQTDSLLKVIQSETKPY